MWGWVYTLKWSLIRIAPLWPLYSLLGLEETKGKDNWLTLNLDHVCSRGLKLRRGLHVSKQKLEWGGHEHLRMPHSIFNENRVKTSIYIYIYTDINIHEKHTFLTRLTWCDRHAKFTCQNVQNTHIYIYIHTRKPPFLILWGKTTNII